MKIIPTRYHKNKPYIYDFKYHENATTLNFFEWHSGVRLRSGFY